MGGVVTKLTWRCGWEKKECVMPICQVGKFSISLKKSRSESSSFTRVRTDSLFSFTFSFPPSQSIYLSVCLHTHTHTHTHTYIYIYIYIYVGSIFGWVIPKTQKMVLDAALLNTEHYNVCIKVKVEKSRDRICALPYTSV